ncbi:unnamed protein product [Amoebophrya sp. A25]|nr:unnamed protein product [Amoebophrya sp. A25]|eukprot:GSA25T00015902001.1
MRRLSTSLLFYSYAPSLLLSSTNLKTVLADDGETVQADPSYIEIINGIREFRNGLVEHFDQVAQALEKGADTSAPARSDQPGLVRSFASNWLSLLGWSSGITGLAKDFVTTYFGRSFFHDHNGPLLDALRHAAQAILRDDRAQRFPRALRSLTDVGYRLFSEEGPLRTLFMELRDLQKHPKITEALSSSGTRDTLEALSKALKFLTKDLKHHKVPDLDDDDSGDDVEL